MSDFRRYAYLIWFLAAAVSASGRAAGAADKGDTANLARYAEDNRNLILAGEVRGRVVFMGDSITEWWGEGIGSPPYYVNRGIAGQSTQQMIQRFNDDVLALKPAVVVILAGTNDIAGNSGPTTLSAIEANLQNMVELALSNNIRVVLASVLPCVEYNWIKKPAEPALDPAKNIPELNRWIKDYADTHHAKGVVYLDYFTRMTDFKKGPPDPEATLFKDGVHPNDNGYAVMLPLLKDAIVLVSAIKISGSPR